MQNSTFETGLTEERFLRERDSQIFIARDKRAREADHSQKALYQESVCVLWWHFQRLWVFLYDICVMRNTLHLFSSRKYILAWHERKLPAFLLNTAQKESSPYIHQNTFYTNESLLIKRRTNWTYSGHDLNCFTRFHYDFVFTNEWWMRLITLAYSTCNFEIGYFCIQWGLTHYFTHVWPNSSHPIKQPTIGPISSRFD